MGAVLGALAAGCGTGTGIHTDKLLVGLVFDAGGKDDKSFNSAAWAGARRAQADFDIVVRDVEPGDAASIEPAVRALAEAGFHLVFGIGFANAPYIAAVAQDFPERAFCIVDAPAEGDNVASLVFREHEGSFLVGYLAGRASRTNAVGFIGGMDIPLIHRFAMGYEAGARHARPGIRVFVNYAGITPMAWSDPTRGKELALIQYARGADIIFAAAGATGLGVFDAAEEQDRLVIGSDSNQNWIKPGHVLTSMLKRLDVAVYETIADLVRGTFTPGIHEFGLANHGVEVAMDEYNRSLLPDSLRREVAAVRAAIISGALSVPDYYDTLP